MLETQKESTKIYFNNIAEDYDRTYSTGKPVSVRAYIFSSRKKYVLSMFDLKNGLVLDIGCGPGVLTEELLKSGCEVWGIDFSKAMIELANKKMFEKGFKDNIHFSIGDVERLDFPEAYFDFVLCIGVLEYLKDDSIALKEIQRVLKHRGQVIITVPNMASPFVLVDKIVLIIAKLFLRIINNILSIVKMKLNLPCEKLSFRNNIVDKYYLPWRLNNKLEENGFKINKTIFHAFRSAILSSISPKLALFLAKKSELLSRTPLRWIGVNYIVKASKE